MRDINFYFDPVCPFAWMTSKWVRLVMRQRDYSVDWRFISLRLINADVDYDAQFPPEYEAGHSAGLRLLRVAAAARAEFGPAAVGRLYAAFGAHIFDTPPEGADDLTESERRGTPVFVEPILAEAGLPVTLADALEDVSFDALIRAEIDEALSLTGRDVGTPIIHFQPPTGSRVLRPGDQPPPGRYLSSQVRQFVGQLLCSSGWGWLIQDWVGIFGGVGRRVNRSGWAA